MAKSTDHAGVSETARLWNGRVAPLRIPKTAELIANTIRRWIVQGDLKENDALPSETELLQQFGVSRPTIREAFRILESESLIYVRRGAGGGARVQIPNEAVAGRSVGLLLQLRGTTLADIWAARLLIEPPLAGQLANSHTEAALAELRESIEAHKENLLNPTGFALATAHFHYLVTTLAGNQTLALLAGLLDEIFQLHATRVATDQSRNLDHAQLNKTTLRSHTKLVTLIEAGEAAPAEAFWKRHLELAGTVMLGERGSGAVVDLYSQNDPQQFHRLPH
jgi:GntR family transcriptional regulator, transcriptional repressor for pyruvate dehydrogenase complex